MISIYQMKPVFQNCLRPCMRKLAQAGVTPNQVTVSAMILSVLGGVLLWCSQFFPVLLLTIPLLLLVRMALNALDGMLAREYQQSTPLGEIFNEVGDILSDTALYLPLLALFANSRNTVLFIALFLLFSCLTEFCGVLAKAMTGRRRYDGPMGKSDRAFFISILAVALYFWPGGIHQAGTVVFLILNLLLVVSCANRLRYILFHSEGIEHD